MSCDFPESGEATAFVLVGLALLAIPTGLALAEGMATSSTAMDTEMVLTPSLPPVHLTDTPTPTPTPDGGDDATDGENGGHTHFVNVGVGEGFSDDATAGRSGCENAPYTSIQEAVNAAEQGDTVHVCEGNYQSVAIPRSKANLTLQANDGAVIESAGQPAIRSNASSVIIRGFKMRTTGAAYTLSVGGPETLIRNNTVEMTRQTENFTGIFLSDGLTPDGGEPDSSLGQATGTRVVNNIINGSKQNTNHYGLFVDADQVLVRSNAFFAEDNTTSIRSSGNRTIIQDNTVLHLDPCRHGALGEGFVTGHICREDDKAPSFLIGGYHQNPHPQYFNSHCFKVRDEEYSSKHNWALQNRLKNNYVYHSPGPGLEIWGKGDHTETMAATKGIVVQDNTFFQTGGVVAFVDGGLFLNNTIDVDNYMTGESVKNEGALEGGFCGHVDNTQILNNTMTDYQAERIFHGNNFTIRGNTFSFSKNQAILEIVPNNPFSEHPSGDSSGRIRFIDNKVTNAGGEFKRITRPAVFIRQSEIPIEFAHNNITGNERTGVGLAQNIKNKSGSQTYDQRGTAQINFHHNTITNNKGNGVTIGYRENGCTAEFRECIVEINRFHHNTITGNEETGVFISKNSSLAGFHGNLIDNNGDLGIHKRNNDKSDSDWPVVNATRNIWGCGGPSGGLQDPYTNRTANGTGDAISAGDELGKSNIHFDPFFVRQDVTCTAGMAQPTPTPSPTPTPTPSPTLTPTTTLTQTPTPMPTHAAGFGNGTGGTGGNGTGGTGDGTGDSGVSREASTNSTGEPTTITLPQSTRTPTPPPTPTISPTPRIEPGFGVLTWILGAVLLGVLVGLRRKVPLEDKEDS